MTEAWIIDACRTPRGVGKAGKGALWEVHPQQLGATVLKALAEKADSFKGSDMITVRTTVNGRTTKSEFSIHEGIFKIGGEVRSAVSGGGSGF